MEVWQAALWGLAGGVCVEALELYANIHRASKWSWRRPIKQGLTAFITALIIRVGVAAVVAAAAAGSHQISGPLAAFGFGVSAPLVIVHLARAVPMTGEIGTPAQQAVTRRPRRSSARGPDALGATSQEQIPVPDAEHEAL